jgi:hypothetical protein
MYFYIAIVFFIVLVLIYKKLTNKFWYHQPVYHYWDIQYWMYNKGIIMNQLPEKNKYCNFHDIVCNTFDNCSDYHKKEFLLLINEHYNEGIYKPTIKCLNTRMKTIYPSFYSLYLKDVTYKYKDKIINDKEVIGSMLTNPILINIVKNEKTLDAYYADFLCVDKKHRKKNLAAQIIQTHEYYQRHHNKKIAISLFKKEGELVGIVPVCIFYNYFFSLTEWKIKPVFDKKTKIIKVDTQNIYYLYNKIIEQQELFDILIYRSLDSMIEMIKEDIFVVYMVMREDEILSAYFYQRYENFIDGKEIITCNSSILFSFSKEEFIEYFKKSLYLLCQKYSNIHYLNMENISHNYLLVNNLLLSSNPFEQSINAYFFYNYAYNAFLTKKTFIFI